MLALQQVLARAYRAARIDCWALLRAGWVEGSAEKLLKIAIKTNKKFSPGLLMKPGFPTPKYARTLVRPSTFFTPHFYFSRANLNSRSCQPNDIYRQE